MSRVVIFNHAFLSRLDNWGRKYGFGILVVVLIGCSTATGQHNQRFSRVALTGEISNYENVYTSNDGEILLTQKEIGQGVMTYYRVDRNQLSNQIPERIFLKTMPDDELGIHIVGLKKYNGYWYLHLKGMYEYIYKCDLLLKESEMLYAGKMSRESQHHDFYISDEDEIYLYRWVAVGRSKNVVEVNRVVENNLETIFGLDHFYPEILVSFSENYKCVDVYKDQVFLMDPASGMLSVHRFHQRSSDTIRFPVYAVSDQMVDHCKKLAIKYRRSSTMKVFDEVINMEDSLIHFERLNVLNDSILVVNSFKYGGLKRDSLIFYNYQKMKVVHVFENQFEFSNTALAEEKNYFSLYYKKWSLADGRLLVIMRYTKDLDDQDLKSAGDLFRLGERRYRYLWCVDVM